MLNHEGDSPRLVMLLQAFAVLVCSFLAARLPVLSGSCGCVSFVSRRRQICDDKRGRPSVRSSSSEFPAFRSRGEAPCSPIIIIIAQTGWLAQALLDTSQDTTHIHVWKSVGRCRDSAR